MGWDGVGEDRIAWDVLGLYGMGCDAITISPYMGREAIHPFIENPENCGVLTELQVKEIGGQQGQKVQLTMLGARLLHKPQ